MGQEVTEEPMGTRQIAADLHQVGTLPHRRPGQSAVTAWEMFHQGD